jgi:hypothetical protein
MQGFVMAVDLSLERLNAPSERLALSPQRGNAIWRTIADRGDLVAKHAHDPLSITINVNNREESLLKTFCFKSLLNNFESRLLLTDDKNCFVAPDRIRDHVHDGLALARSWRTFYK